ncbi:nitric oxide reductase activation protein [Gammaproteobacteria bacterium]|nr:nitric oxide reductase activation protein [Gammaproteobacteria bacterium]
MHISSTRLSADQILEQLNQTLDPVLSSSRTAARPAAELALCSDAEQSFALRWLEIIARTNSELGFQFIAHVPHAFRNMSLDQVETWLIQALDIYDRQGLYPGSQSLANVDDFLRTVESSKGEVRLDSRLNSILVHYLDGLSARSLHIKSGTAPTTDTETIFLPERLEVFSSKAQNTALYRMLVTQMWAQSYFGTFRRKDQKTPTLSDQLDQYSDPARARVIFQRVEQARLDACIKRAFPGLARQMKALNTTPEDPTWHTLIEPLLNPHCTVEDSLELVSTLYHSKAVIPESLPWACEIDIIHGQQATDARVAKNQRDLAEALSNWLEEDMQSTDILDSVKIENAATDASTNQDPPSFTLSLDGAVLTPPTEIQDLMQSIFLDLGEIQSSGSSGASEDDQYDGQSPGGPPESSEESLIAAPEDALVYDEWDFRRGHYRKAWCYLKELEMPEGKIDFYAQTIEKYKGSLISLRRSFETLRNRTQRLKHQNNGDEIDLDALIDARVSAFSGAEMSDQILSRLDRRERDIAVIFMVDVSGSTKGWINDAERECLALLCEALEILGDRYAIYGFSGMTRKRCELYRVKEINEPFSQTVKSRIAGIEPRDYTRMGVTIRHLTKIMNQVSARSRLLITLSDGKPDDYDGYRGEYGIEDTRQALIEAKRAGIHPFCITIDQQAREYLPHMYGAVNYTVIDDVRQLPTKVAAVYRQLTI